MTHRPPAAAALRCALVLVALLGAVAPALAADGAWTFIPPEAGPDSLPGPRLGGGMAWDADRDRIILVGGRQGLARGSAPAPLVLLTAGAQWSAPTVVGPQPPATLGPWAIDRSRNRLVSLAGLSAIWSMDLDTFVSQVDTVAGPTPIFDTDPAYAGMDSTRDQIFLYGVEKVFPEYRMALWTLPLHGTPTWVKRATTGPAPFVTYTPDANARFLYDTRRDRFVYLSPYVNGILVLSPQPTWLADPGLPGFGDETGACYDPVRDLVVTFGGITPDSQPLDTLVWSRPEAPTQVYVATEPTPAPSMAFPILAFDGTRDRMIAAGGADGTAPLAGAWSYAPPTPVRADVECNLVSAAFPGTPLDFALRVTNTSSGGARLTYEVRCDRDWPNVTRTVNALFAGGAAAAFDVRFAVPDTAAPGPVHLRVSACCNTDGDPSSLCAPRLLVVARPAAPVLVSAVVEGDTAVALRWESAPGAASSTTLLRSVNGCALDTVAVLAPDAAGTVAYVDRGVPAGAALRYQLGIDTPAGPVWSDPVALGAATGAAPALAFGFRPSMLVVHGALDVAFSVPHAGAARVEAYDVGGRLVAARVVDSPGAGIQTARLADAGALRSGIYFLRLTLGPARAHGRVLLLPGP